jgi:AcrR family transcriptional regulator
MATTEKTSRGKGSLTEKGRATRAAILDAAHGVIKAKGFYSTSVSEIARNCNVSMGTFYQYFKNKEQAFQELNDRIISDFLARAASISMDMPAFEVRLQRIVELLFSHTQANLAFHSVLGEPELVGRVTIAYYESIARYYRDFFRQEAQAGNIVALDPDLIAYALIGICYFHCLNWQSEPDAMDRPQMVPLILDFVLHGINGAAFWEKDPGWNWLSIPQPAEMRQPDEAPLTKGEKTRQAIFAAAEQVIGRYGINRANISEITRQAGVAQGTFYVHFKSKHDLIEGFVKYFNRKMRRDVQRVAGQTRDRRDAERVGVLAFFQFVGQHRDIYRIVPEWEIIGRQVSLWYYNKIAHGYIQGLQRGIAKNEIRGLPPVFLARTLMGLTHFIALKWIIWNPSPHPEIPKHLLSDVLHFLFYGIKPNIG